MTQRRLCISEDGMVEVDKSLFSIEPMLRVGDSLLNWSNSEPVQSMVFAGIPGEVEFIPSVTWQHGAIKFVTGVSSGGTANENSLLYIGYSFENLSDRPVDFEFYLWYALFRLIHITSS